MTAGFMSHTSPDQACLLLMGKGLFGRRMQLRMHSEIRRSPTCPSPHCSTVCCAAADEEGLTNERCSSESEAGNSCSDPETDVRLLEARAGGSALLNQHDAKLR